MGRIRVLPDQVANQIAAGEVVDRPASVVKELLENALDAGASRIRVEVEAGGRQLIRVSDDGQGMNRDDALLAFERHATSKLRTADDLLSIATLGFRGEALPSIASVARVTLETATRETSAGEPSAGTVVEIAGGKILRVEDAALPRGTTLAVADLFFNTPARRKFLRAESTELAHVTALVTHYALAHPEKHFELLSARTRSSPRRRLPAPPSASTRSSAKRRSPSLLPVAAEAPLERAGLPEPPPWKKDPDEPPRDPGSLRLSRLLFQAGTAKAEPQLDLHLREQAPHPRPAADARDHRGLSQRHSAHQLSRGAALPRNAARRSGRQRAPCQNRSPLSPAIAGPRLCPRQPAHGADQSAPGRGIPRRARFCATGQPVADAAGRFAASRLARERVSPDPIAAESDRLPSLARNLGPLSTHAEAAHAGPRAACPLTRSPFSGKDPRAAQFLGEAAATLSSSAAGSAFRATAAHQALTVASYAADVRRRSQTAQVEAEQAAANLNHLGSLQPLGQLRESFILATGEDGLWIIDQHVAHERVLFEKILRDRQVEKIQRQRLLMPMLVELKPGQMVVFARIAEELEQQRL